MAEIFGCKGVCEECEAMNVCPMKGEFDKNFERKISGAKINGKPLLKKYLELKNKIDPQTIIRVNHINLFNFIQGIIILWEIGEITSVKRIEEQIIGAMEKKRRLLESKNYTPLKARILLLVEKMSALIFSALQKNCSAENCQSCWLEQECPQQKTL